jgi:Fe-S-cluster containining protein
VATPTPTGFDERERIDDEQSSDRPVSRGRAETVMLPLLRDVDERIEATLDQVRADGIVPTCQRGCAHCCRQQVHASVTEVAALAEHVRRTLSPKDLAALRRRIDSWQSWVDTESMWLIETGLDEAEAFEQYGPNCPLLVNDECIAYEVRPLVCRAHYVTSEVRLCMPRQRGEEPKPRPELVDEVAESARPVAMRLRAMIEASGQRFEEAVELLPVGLGRLLRSELRD